MRNSIEFRLWGRNAIWTDPITKMGGEMCTYSVPTYEALKGIVEAIYWKPTIVWYIDKVRVMKKIQTENKNIKLPKLNLDKGGSDLFIYTYLSDVEYQVSAHFEMDMTRDDMVADRNENKHHNLAKRYLNKGGKRDLFLGKRECVGFVEPVEFGTGKGCYDDTNEMNFGIMFHSFNYPTSQSKKFGVNLDYYKMNNGIISFSRPENCKANHFIKNMDYQRVETDFDESDREILEEVEQ